jgi:hypothetical protein
LRHQGAALDQITQEMPAGNACHAIECSSAGLRGFEHGAGYGALSIVL